MPCLIPRGISLKQLMCSLFLSFDLEQFFHFAKCTLAVLLFHLVSCRFIPFNFALQSSIIWEIWIEIMEVCRKTSRELSVAHRQQYPGTRSFPYRDCDWTECGLLALRACPKPFSAKKHQFNLSIFLNRVIKGLVCSGSRPSDSRTS